MEAYKRLTLGVAVAGVALATSLLSSGDVAAQGPSDRTFIAIGTGGPTGVYFVVGNAICRMIHKGAAEGRRVLGISANHPGRHTLSPLSIEPV